LETYKSHHYAALPKTIQGVATNEDMLQRLSKGGLLLLGDIHDDKSLHLLHAQVIQQLIHSKQKLYLHLEFIGTEDEPGVASYLSGAMDLDELRLQIQERWAGSWMEFQGFDSVFYRRVLMTAKDREIQVRALEPIPRLDLEKRDRFMAQGITKALADYPDHLHIVIIGHTHLLGDGHLISLLNGVDRLAILPRGGRTLTHRLGAFASLHSAAWHAPYLVLDEELWLLNPLPLRSFGAD